MSMPPFPRLSWWRRIWRMVMPPVPDFYGMLEAQADNLRATVATLVDYLQGEVDVPATQIHTMVDEGHALRDRTLAALYSVSFLSPRERCCRGHQVQP